MQREIADISREVDSRQNHITVRLSMQNRKQNTLEFGSFYSSKKKPQNNTKQKKSIFIHRKNLKKSAKANKPTNLTL